MTLITPDTDQGQAALFNARERTRLFRGHELDIPQTHRIVGTTAIATTIPAGSFRGRDAIATFRVRIRIDASTPAGQIFSFGDATGAISLFVTNTDVIFRAGGATVNTNANSVSLAHNAAVGAELNIIAMVRPDGLVGLWIPEFGRITWQDTGAFSVWANDVVGDFGQAATAMPADVTQTGAPLNFTIIGPLSVFYGSFPRIGIGAEL